MRVNIPRPSNNPPQVPEAASGFVEETGQVASALVGKIVESGQTLLDTATAVITSESPQVVENLKQIGPVLEKVTVAYRNILDGAVGSVRDLNKVDLNLSTDTIGQIMTDVADGLVRIEEAYAQKSSLKPIRGTIDVSLTLRALPGGPGVEAALHLELERVDSEGVVVNLRVPNT